MRKIFCDKCGKEIIKGGIILTCYCPDGEVLDICKDCHDQITKYRLTKSDDDGKESNKEE